MEFSCQLTIQNRNQNLKELKQNHAATFGIVPGLCALLWSHRRHSSHRFHMYTFPLSLLISHELTQTIPTGFGAAYGTAKSGVGIMAIGVMRPELVMKSVVPVIMAGIIAIYGLVVGVLVIDGSMCFY